MADTDDDAMGTHSSAPVMTSTDGIVMDGYIVRNDTVDSDMNDEDEGTTGDEETEHDESAVAYTNTGNWQPATVSDDVTSYYDGYDQSEILETIESEPVREQEINTDQEAVLGQGDRNRTSFNTHVQSQDTIHAELLNVPQVQRNTDHVEMREGQLPDFLAASTGAGQLRCSESTNSQPVSDGHIQSDPSSLFVPEHDSQSQHIVAPPICSTGSSIPSRIPSRSAASKQSHIARIREMKRKLQEKKNASSKRAAAERFNVNPDHEDYLEAVTSGVTPSTSELGPDIDPDERAHRNALAEYQKKKRFYDEAIRQKGKLSFKEDIEWMKIKAAEKSRITKRQRDLMQAPEGEEDPGLFPEVGTAVAEERSLDPFDLGVPGPSRKRKRQDSEPKGAMQGSMQDAEYQAMLVGVEAQAENPKKKKREKSTDGSPQGSQPSSKDKKPRSKPKPKITTAKVHIKGPVKTRKNPARQKRERDRIMEEFGSLFNANVFKQQAKQDDPEQPTFQSRRKDDALKELIASVPIEDKKEARTDMNILLQATKEFNGRGAVKASNGNWLVKGMRTTLKGYQVLGTAFMRRRENGVEQPRGGLDADQMGLGKTLMMLANIVNGRPPKGEYPRTTLLVAAPSLLDQWTREIELHTDCGLRVMRYSAGNRIDSNAAPGVLNGHDIVLTTYAEVMKSYPKNEPPISKMSAESKIKWWKKEYDEQRGVLHRIEFLRIVLDEAQAIKNHQARTSIACRALMATHKWALSGTPILNSLTELYPYFKFLGVPHTGSYKIFKHNYCDPKNGEIIDRLLARLEGFMIRRTHADRMFNAPILKLPRADQGTYWCDFNSVERCIYDIVHQRFMEKINTWSRDNDLERSYNNALVLILRLRQLTAHVLMLQFVMKDLLEVEDIEKIRGIVNDHSASADTENGRTIIAIRKQLEKHAIEEKKKAAAESRGAGVKEHTQNTPGADDSPVQDIETDAEDGPSHLTGQDGARLGGSGQSFGKDFNFLPYLKGLAKGESWDKARKRATCSWCGDQPRRPCITSCGHLICEAPCLSDSYLQAAEIGMEYGTCKACGTVPHNVQPCEFREDEFSDTVAQGTRSRTAQRTRIRRDREDIPEDWLSSISNDVLPSAKTLAIKAQILNWRRENPGIKIIVYTQFLAMVKILARICQIEGWQAEQYVGTMSFKARDKALTKFANNASCNILLASLRCGGLGLNLTMASRVIMVDPWWNSASEQQAFCRVFRIGQKDETYMSRFCVRNTIDQQLIAMQERKETEINEVMERDPSRVKKMTIKDLMRLFGNLDQDEEGRPFIMVDNPQPQGGFRADRDDEGYADDV